MNTAIKNFVAIPHEIPSAVLAAFGWTEVAGTADMDVYDFKEVRVGTVSHRGQVVMGDMLFSIQERHVGWGNTENTYAVIVCQHAAIIIIPAHAPCLLDEEEGFEYDVAFFEMDGELTNDFREDMVF